MTKFFLATATLGLLLSGCASNKDMTSQQSGFLDDYSLLEQSKHDPDALLYISPGVDFSSYANVMVEPVALMANNEQIRENGPLLKEVSQYMTQNLRTRIQKNPNYNLVTQAQANTIKIKFALTAVTVEGSEKKGYQYIPVAYIVSTAKDAAGVTPKDVRVMVELNVTDADTAQVLARALSSQKGEQVVLRTNEKLTFKHLKPALDRISSRVDDRLNELKKQMKK